MEPHFHIGRQFGGCAIMTLTANAWADPGLQWWALFGFFTRDADDKEKEQ
jgi:hypothetical protein